MSRLVDELQELGYTHICTERTPYGFRVYPYQTSSFFYFDHFGRPLSGALL